MTRTYCELEEVIPFPVRVSVIRPTVTSPAVSGQVKTRRTQSSYSRHSGEPEIRRWSLEYQLGRTYGPGDTIDDTEYAAVRDAFKQAAGVGLPVLFTPPGEAQQIPVCFTSNRLRFEHRSPSDVRVRVEVEEFI